MTVRNILNDKKIFFENTNISDVESLSIGGKAQQLLRLQNLAVNIPKWLVLTSQTLDLVFTGNNCSFEQNLKDALLQKFDAKTKFAVRSSASVEDGIKHSFAGQFDTLLNVPLNGIFEAIEKVYKSKSSDLVQKYCTENILIKPIQMSIIIQEMLEPDVAGVAFGFNPQNGDRQQKVVSAVYGLGEGLVSGELDADTFIVGSDLEQVIANKKQMRVSCGSEGTKLISVPIEKQNKPTLSELQLREIVEILDKTKGQFGKIQDIEFAYVKEKLYLLQTRPVTGLENIPDKKGQFTLWDNSNIIESYPGISSPLTFSFILKVYEAAYRQLTRLFGVSEKQITSNKSTYANLLGILEGRVYYNLQNWYKLLALLPGFSLNARFMESMMGVKERFELADQKSMGKIEAWYRVIISMVKMIWQLIRLPKKTKSFHSLLDSTISKYRKIDFTNRRSEELMNDYLDFEELLLKKWKAPLVNDIFAMIFFGLLQKLSGMYFSDHPNIHNELIADSGDIISTEPAKMLIQIATDIQEDSDLKDLFLNKEKNEIWEELKTATFLATRNKIADFIDRFGDRCMGELKLETITYRQNPVALIHILKSYVVQGIVVNANQGLKTNLSARSIVSKRLKGKWFKRTIFNYITRQARRLVSGRENLRFERTRAFGIVREIFLAIGVNWYSEGILAEPRDIFYLSQNEIFNFINGTSINADLNKLIELRKESQERFENQNPPPERIATYGIVNHGNDFFQKVHTEILDSDLSGIGCSPGRIHGRVQVISHPSEIDSLKGDILATTSTDPGWVALFPTASAILVERGSLLSHSAIVAREMGIPCIVGINGLLAKIKTGDIIEMDGATGKLLITS